MNFDQKVMAMVQNLNAKIGRSARVNVEKISEAEFFITIRGVFVAEKYSVKQSGDGEVKWGKVR